MYIFYNRFCLLFISLSLRSWFFTWYLLQWWTNRTPDKYRGCNCCGKVAQLPPAMSETTPASVQSPQSVRQRPVTCGHSDSETWRWSLARRWSSEHHLDTILTPSLVTILTPSWHYPDPACRRCPPARASTSTSPYLCPRWSGAPVSTSPGNMKKQCDKCLVTLVLTTVFLRRFTPHSIDDILRKHDNTSDTASISETKPVNKIVEAPLNLSIPRGE